MADPTPREKRIFSAYYYQFTATGVLEIDQILMAVARAGKRFHNTDQWDETIMGSTEPTPTEEIQKAADRAAAAIRARGDDD